MRIYKFASLRCKFLNKEFLHSPHQQFWQMTTALHQLANQFCEVNLLQNGPQNPQNFLHLKTQGTFHLGWKKKDNSLTIIRFQNCSSQHAQKIHSTTYIASQFIHSNTFQLIYMVMKDIRKILIIKCSRRHDSAVRCINHLKVHQANLIRIQQTTILLVTRNLYSKHNTTI